MFECHLLTEMFFLLWNDYFIVRQAPYTIFECFQNNSNNNNNNNKTKKNKLQYGDTNFFISSSEDEKTPSDENESKGNVPVETILIKEGMDALLSKQQYTKLEWEAIWQTLNTSTNRSEIDYNLRTDIKPAIPKLAWKPGV